MTPDAARETLNEALYWVNNLRHDMGASPLSDWPKSIPGSEYDCLLARAIKHENRHLIRVRIGCSSYHVEWLPPLRPRRTMCSTRWAESGDPISVSTEAPRREALERELPHACKRVVHMFDNGDLPQYIAREETDRRNKAATPKHLQGKPIAMLTDPVHLDKPLTATEIGEMWKSMAHQILPPPPALAALKPASTYFAPDWASMLKTPEAPVKVLEEEPIEV